MNSNWSYETSNNRFRHEILL